MLDGEAQSSPRNGPFLESSSSVFFGRTDKTTFFEPMEAAAFIDLLTTQFRLDTRTKFKHNETPSQ
jgi:hypothetical protein